MTLEGTLAVRLRDGRADCFDMNAHVQLFFWSTLECIIENRVMSAAGELDECVRGQSALEQGQSLLQCSPEAERSGQGGGAADERQSAFNVSTERNTSISSATGAMCRISDTQGSEHDRPRENHPSSEGGEHGAARTASHMCEVDSGRGGGTRVSDSQGSEVITLHFSGWNFSDHEAFNWV